MTIPIIVVGNITVGGTGKTPLVGWLVEVLTEKGFNPGIVMRGYGGNANKNAALIERGASPQHYGDEAIMLKNRYDCLVAVGRNRTAAAALLQSAGADIVISDDGLQHYSLARDIEIAVLDGERGIGNGLLLPAGPLREPVSRLEEVDWVISNKRKAGLASDETVMNLIAEGLVNLASGEMITLEEALANHPEVNVVCGIGNPYRFLNTLSELSFVAEPRIFKDHHEFKKTDLIFANEYPILCTEKDAIKIMELDTPLEKIWFLKVSVSIPQEEDRLSDLLSLRKIEPISAP